MNQLVRLFHSIECSHDYCVPDCPRVTGIPPWPRGEIDPEGCAGQMDLLGLIEKGAR